MKLIFYRHSLLNRGGDKMVLAHAAHLVSNNHDVTILTNQVNTLFSIDPRIKITSIKFKGKIGTLVSALLFSYDADWIIADIIPLACLLSTMNRKRVLYFAQDYDESYYVRSWEKQLIRLAYRFGLSWMKLPSLAVSSSLACLLRHKFNADVSVARNGVDTARFYPEYSEKLQRSKGGRKCILILSRSDHRKGFDIAQDTIQLISMNSPVPVTVWTVGNNAKGKFPDSDHRDFGYVGENELRSIFSNADIFLYPTRHEGYGLMVAEAFACKCPVVTTDAVWFASDRVNALVSSAEQVNVIAKNIIELLTDEGLCHKIVEQGYRFAGENSLSMGLMEFEKRLRDLTTQCDRA